MSLLVGAVARAHERPREHGAEPERLALLARQEVDQRAAQQLGVAHAIEIIQDNFAALPARLAEASVALMPRVECPGLPQKLLNYMAAGKAVVAFAGSAKATTSEIPRGPNAQDNHADAASVA